MLQTLQQMALSKATPVPPRNWAAIPNYLKEKVAGGASKNSAAKIRSAANGLLKSKGMTAENAPVNLEWFDRMFPADGWDPATMPFEQATYTDCRHRVRPLIQEMLGVAGEEKSLRAAVDEWDEGATELESLEGIAGPHSKKKMIPYCNTLTMASRRARIRTIDFNQPTLMKMYDNAKKSERLSLRTVSRTISVAQKVSPVIARLFPHPIQAIEVDGAFRYAVPEHFTEELEEFVERAARKKYIRAKKIHEYVKPGTRSGMRTTMRAVVDGLISSGHLDPFAETFAKSLENEEALADLLGHIVDRIGEDGITARHATTLVSRLPVIFERNGIDSTLLRDLIKEVEELGQHSEKAGMPERTKRLCRALIERRKFKNAFLLAHAKTRSVAQDLLNAATRKSRSLTPDERLQVIRHGSVALFCAIEVGGAPARVENVLQMPFGGEKAWLRLVGNDVRVVIPGAFVKNGEEIRFDMAPGPYHYVETVRWYLEHVRPLILRKRDADKVADAGAEGNSAEANADGEDDTVPSPWLLPMLSDASRPCPYETFHGWFVRIMRDVVGVPCTPHNYRHGQASLLYHHYPERIGWIARRLGDTQETVITHYAWVHKEKAMAEGQRLIVELIER